MKALIVYHKTKQDLGTIKEMLEKRGFTLDYRFGEDDELPKISENSHDLAVFLGGPMGVYESGEHPYLLNEIDYIQRRLKADKPLLGICLGAQLIAQSLGGDVYKGAQGREVGWCDVQINGAGLKTPMRHFDPSKTKIMQAHQDTFDFPKGAELLGSSDMYNTQAYRVGGKVMATQFHPEADQHILDYWLKNKKDFFDVEDNSPEKMLAEAKLYLSILKTQTALFMNEWLDDVLPKSGNNNA